MILFIDDDVSGMRPYRMALEDANFVVMTATNPDEAMAIIGEQVPPEAIILDILLPTGTAISDADSEYGLHTGIALYELLRSSGVNAPVIVLSITQVVLPPAIAKAGRSEVLQKLDTTPFELVDVVKKMLGQTEPTHDYEGD